MTATDAQVAPYADDYYQYGDYQINHSQQVTLETTQGAGADGPGTYTYSYTTSTNTSGYNRWKTKTIETQPDGNTNTYYTNDAGEVMLTDFHDINDPTNPSLQGDDWITLDLYDSQGRLTEEVEPSTFISDNGAYYDETKGGLMNFQADGTSPYLSDSSGVIHLDDYGTATTATSTTAGDVLGYAKDEKIQVGQTGTSVLLSSAQYIKHTAGGVTVYPQASSTIYRNTDGTGAETTSDAYTWYTGTNQIESDTTTAPVIASAQNGPGTADTTTVYYDTYGRPIWTKDGDGYIDYIAYDNATGAVVTSITDVNTADTGEFSGLPSGWSTPAGGGLNLVTQALVERPRSPHQGHGSEGQRDLLRLRRPEPRGPRIRRLEHDHRHAHRPDDRLPRGPSWQLLRDPDDVGDAAPDQWRPRRHRGHLRPPVAGAHLHRYRRPRHRGRPVLQDRGLDLLDRRAHRHAEHKLLRHGLRLRRQRESPAGAGRQRHDHRHAVRRSRPAHRGLRRHR